MRHTRSHVGERAYNKQGLVMEIKKWLGRERVQIEFLETGEQKFVSYIDFRKGRVQADLMNHPVGFDAPFKHAVFIMVSMIALILAAVCGLTYWLLR